ncbi:MAG: hypothetical protein ABI051_06870 [Vicinamibacterales bacterium]
MTWGDDVVVSTAPGAVTIKPTLDVPGTYMVTVRTESGASNPLMLDVKK